MQNSNKTMRRVLCFWALIFLLLISNVGVLVQGDNSLVIMIEGKLSHVEDPMITCSDNGRIYIIWGESFEINYGGTDVIFIQELDTLGNPIGEKVLVADHDDITGAWGLGSQKIESDSENNLHIFWGIFDRDGNPGSIFYTKLDPNLNTLVDTKRIIAFWFYSYQQRSIQQVYIDSNDSIHLLAHNRNYVYMDSVGNILGTFDVQDEEIGEATCLEIDSKGNAFISTLNDSHNVYLIHLESTNGSTTKIGIYTVLTDFENHIRTPIIVYEDNSLHIFCRIYLADYTYELFCKKIDYSGDIIGSSNIAMANIDLEFKINMLNFLSRDRSNVYCIYLKQFGSKGDNAILNFSLSTFHNEILTYPINFLTILKDPSLFYGPSICGFHGEEDINGFFWFSWYVNAGNNGFQAMILKLDSQGIPCFNVVTIAPEYFQYSTSATTISWIEFSSLAAVFAVVYLIRKRRKS